MALSVSDNISTTDRFTFLDAPKTDPEDWLEVLSACRQRPQVIKLQGQHPGLSCLVLNVDTDEDVLARLSALLCNESNLLCTDTRIVLLPSPANTNKVIVREYYQTILSWQPDFLIDISVACCPEPLAFGYRRQPGSAILARLFSAYTVNGCYSPTSLTRYLWPCPSIELLLPRHASDKSLQDVCQVLSQLEVTADANNDTSDSWLRSVYRLDALKAAGITFSDRPVFGMNITLALPDTSKAFVTLHPGESLGWLDHNGLDHLRLKGASAQESLSDFFDASDNRLLVRVPLTCFLIADSVDCLREQGIMHFSPVRC